MIPRETILVGAPDTCEDCGVTVEFKVLRSNEGYYIGTECNCGPYSRESEYLGNTRDWADEILAEWQMGRYVHARGTDFIAGKFR